MRNSPLALAAITLLTLVHCAAEPDDPEARVRALIDQVVEASRAKDLAALKDTVSEGYADPAGRTREDIHNLMRVHHLRAGTVYVLARIEELEFPEPQRARVQVLAALASTPVSEPAALRGVRSDVYRFDTEVQDEDGDWRLTSAVWRPASLEDFF